MAMESNRIEFDRDVRKEEYIEKVFKKSHIYFESEKTANRVEYMFVCDKETKNRILCALICSFYKFNEIMRVFGDKETDAAFYALIGALIGLDSEEDVDKVSSAIVKYDFINVDGFYNFCIPEIKEAWRGLAELAKRLYVQCKSTDEVYALCIFMLGMGDNEGETIVITPRKELYWEYNKTDISVIPYFGEKEADLIVTLLSNHPSNVVVSDPSSVSGKLISVIKALGE